jgi:hypothetical protein
VTDAAPRQIQQHRVPSRIFPHPPDDLDARPGRSRSDGDRGARTRRFDPPDLNGARPRTCDDDDHDLKPTGAPLPKINTSLNFAM